MPSRAACTSALSARKELWTNDKELELRSENLSHKLHEYQEGGVQTPVNISQKTLWQAWYQRSCRFSSPHFLADTSSVFAVRHYFLAHIWIGVNWRRLSAPLTGWRPPNLSWSIKLISLLGESPMSTLVTLARTMWVIVESGSLGDKATVSLNGNTRRRTWASTWKRILKPSRKQVTSTKTTVKTTFTAVEEMESRTKLTRCNRRRIFLAYYSYYMCQ